MAFTIPKLERLRELLLAATIARPFNGRSIQLQYSGNNPVVSYSSGRVTQAGYDANGGFVAVQSPNGFTYIYRQLGSLLSGEARNGGGPEYGSPNRRVGDIVEAGDIVGWQGAGGFDFALERAGWPIDPTGNNSTNPAALFFRLYHVLGLGGGDIGGAGQIDRIPDPYTLSYAPVPTVLELPAWATGGGGGGKITGAPPGPNDDFWAGVGGGVGQVVGGVGQGIGGGLGLPSLGQLSQLLPGLAPAITLLLLGGLMVIAGLMSLSKEKPVQAVTQPITATAGTVKKGVELAAVAA